MRKLLKFLSARLPFLMVLAGTLVMAQSANIVFRLSWDANTESDMDFYNVFMTSSPTTSTNLSQTFAVVASVNHTNVVRHNWDIPRANWGRAVYVTAVNTNQLESLPSAVLLVPSTPSNPKNVGLQKLTN